MRALRGKLSKSQRRVKRLEKEKSDIQGVLLGKIKKLERMLKKEKKKSQILIGDVEGIISSRTLAENINLNPSPRPHRKRSRSKGRSANKVKVFRFSPESTSEDYFKQNHSMKKLQKVKFYPKYQNLAFSYF